MLSFFFPVVFLTAFAVVVFLASVDKGCLAALTTGCVNMNTPSTASCSGDVQPTQSSGKMASNAFNSGYFNSDKVFNSVGSSRTHGNTHGSNIYNSLIATISSNWVSIRNMHALINAYIYACGYDLSLATFSPYLNYVEVFLNYL